MIDVILDDYQRLLGSVDRWFEQCREVSGVEISCAKGCSECCRGMFDITLLDACLLKQGVDLLPSEIRERVESRARKRIESLRLVRPDLEPPYILTVWPEHEWEELLMPDDDEHPCPLLGDDGGCLVYSHRPMTCRLHGMPLVDRSGEVFHDEWCTLNFRDADPMSVRELQWGFRDLFEVELALFQKFTCVLLNHEFNELDTFIAAAVLTDFSGFDWIKWCEEKRGRIRREGCEGSR